MPFDEILAERYRDALRDISGTSEKRMMGGICFFLNGNMIGGCHREKDGQGLFMFRVGVDRHAEALKRKHAFPMPMGDRMMRGIIAVKEADCDTPALRDWVAYTLAYTATLPPKPGSGAAHVPS